MKTLSLVCSACAAVALSGCCVCNSTNPVPALDEKTAAEYAANMKTVCDFVKTADHYFIATLDGDQPRVRPFGTMNIFEGKLYVQTGRKKNVAKQIAANPKVEICALQKEKGIWIRISGTLVDDPRREAKAAMLDAYPSLKSIYSADDENTEVLYFTNGEAVIYSFTAEPVTLKF